MGGVWHGGVRGVISQREWKIKSFDGLRSGGVVSQRGVMKKSGCKRGGECRVPWSEPG